MPPRPPLTDDEIRNIRAMRKDGIPWARINTAYDLPYRSEWLRYQVDEAHRDQKNGKTNERRRARKIEELRETRKQSHEAGLNAWHAANSSRADRVRELAAQGMRRSHIAGYVGMRHAEIHAILGEPV